jgi:hypothetical protein
MKKATAARVSKAKAPVGTTRSQRIDAALTKLSKLTKALEIGAAAIGALLAYNTLVPKQLGFLGGGAFLIGALGVVASWLGRSWLRRHWAKVVLTAVICLVSLLLLNLRVVREVRYINAQNESAREHLLVGTRLTEFGQSAASQIGSDVPSDLIREAGKAQIPALWADYYFIAGVYVVCFMLLSFFGAMAMGLVVERLLARTR